MTLLLACLATALVSHTTELAGLFTQSQVQNMNVNTPLVAKDPVSGMFKLTIGIQKGTMLNDFAPFPLSPSNCGTMAPARSRCCSQCRMTPRSSGWSRGS